MKNSRIFADLVYFGNVINNGLEWAGIEFNEIGFYPIMKKMYRRGYSNITTLKELAAFRRYNNRYYYYVNSNYKGYCFGLQRMEQKDYTDIGLLKLNCR